MQPEGADPIHYGDLGYDPAKKGYRPEESYTAYQLEKKLGRRLERHPETLGNKGDWFDPISGTIYDAVSPGPSQFFDVQLKNGNYANAVINHAQNLNIDKIVIDFAGRNLTPMQMKAVNEIIQRLPPELRSKVIKFE